MLLRKHSVRLLIVGGALALVTACAATAPQQQDHTLTIYEKKAKSFAWVEIGRGAASPFGDFLLIRRGREACAIRYTAFHRNYDAQPSTFFSSGEENKFSRYEWYYQGDGSFDFSRADVRSGAGELHRGPTIALGHMLPLWQAGGGKWFIECGPFKYWWSYPVGLTFWSYEKGSQPVVDHEVEFAPTKWSRLEAIDYSNPKLHWVNAPREVVGVPGIEWIPMDELP